MNWNEIARERIELLHTAGRLDLASLEAEYARAKASCPWVGPTYARRVWDEEVARTRADRPAKQRTGPRFRGFGSLNFHGSKETQHGK